MFSAKEMMEALKADIANMGVADLKKLSATLKGQSQELYKQIADLEAKINVSVQQRDELLKQIKAEFGYDTVEELEEHGKEVLGKLIASKEELMALLADMGDGSGGQGGAKGD